MSKNLLSRRETMRLIGAAGAAALLGRGAEAALGGPAAGGPGSIARGDSLPAVLRSALFGPSPVRPLASIQTLDCVVKPALTEGPYFVDELLNRSDLRSDPSTNTVKDGAVLKLKFNVSLAGSSACTPLPGAMVDVWHCDALGIYSDVAAGMGNPDTRGQKFLRGYQVTDNNGAAQFTTIYPGYYEGRTVHIHFKIRLFAGSQRTFEFTSQLFFDDTLTDQVFTLAPYNTKSARGTRNSNDGIYNGGGSQLLLTVTPDGTGYTATFNIGVSGVTGTVPSITPVSAASYSATGLATAGLGSIFGADLAAGTLAASAQPLPTTLGGVQLLVRDALGTERAAPLLYVSPTQINFQIPPETNAGDAVFYIARDGAAVGQGAGAVQTVAPGLFAANANGQGLAAAVALRVKADGTQTYEPVAQFNQTTNGFDPVPLDLSSPADALYLIGFGTGFRARSALSAVTCTIGGANATVTYAGEQGSFAGLDQTNILIPNSLAGRGNVEVVFTADGKTANPVTIVV
ncbi:MAG TPA: hypothetical protein VJ302_38035 [Blastocatellia bacterium]|nr:hypothetical protein [Blastocatellia bacterium]